MSHSDKRISAAIAFIILIHIAILTISLLISDLSFLIALINLLVSSSICIYWIQKQIRITQRIFELRERIVLSLEIVVIVCSVYSMFIDTHTVWLTVVNFFILGIHILLFLAFFVFMLTFKMKKLF